MEAPPGPPPRLVADSSSTEGHGRRLVWANRRNPYLIKIEIRRPVLIEQTLSGLYITVSMAGFRDVDGRDTPHVLTLVGTGGRPYQTRLCTIWTLQSTSSMRHILGELVEG